MVRDHKKNVKGQGKFKPYRPQQDIEKLKADFLDGKLDENDRVVVATNLGSLFKDVNRDYPDFVMRRWFLETFDTEEIAESAYKKRHSFIWLSEEIDKRKSSELKSTGRHYLQFLTSLESKFTAPNHIGEEEKRDLLFKRLISRTSLDYQGAERDRQEVVFHNELDLRLSQIIEKMKDRFDMNWWYERTRQLNETNGSLSLESYDAWRWGEDDQDGAIGAPAAKIAEVKTRLLETDLLEIQGFARLQLELDDACLENWPTLMYELQRAFFREIGITEGKTLENLCKNPRGAAGTAAFLKDNSLKKSIDKVSPDDLHPFHLPFLEIDWDGDFKDRRGRTVGSFEGDVLSVFAPINSNSSDNPLSDFVLHSELTMQIRYEESNDAWKPLIGWKGSLIPGNRLHITKLCSANYRKLLPLVTIMTTTVNDDAVYVDDGISGNVYCVYAIIDQDLYPSHDPTVFPHAAEIDLVCVESESYLRSYEAISVSPPDPDFYRLLLSKTLNADGDCVLGKKHSISSNFDNDPSSGAKAPVSSIAHGLLTNLAFGKEGKRFDQKLIEDATEKYNRARTQFETQEQKYVNAINSNLGDEK